MLAWFTMQYDRFEQQISTDSAEAAAYYRDALDYLFCMRSAAHASIDDALQCDPEFALAHCVKARVLLIEGESAAAREAAANAVALAASCGRRERQHAELVARATRNETEGTLAMVREHALSYPRDALPLSFALGVYGLIGFGGLVDQHQQQVMLLESVASAWPEDWWMQSWLGWSYVEVGQLGRGIPLLDASLEVRPDSANTAHGRAHGHYEAGDLEEGKRFLLDWMPTYGQHEPLHCHVAWHLGLLHLQEGDFATAHDIYKRYVRPDVSQALAMFTHIDCAAFSWRSRLYGCPLSQELQDEISTFAGQYFPGPGIPFVNWHTMLVLAQQDADAAAEFARAVADQATQANGLAQEVGARLCNALERFSREDYAGAAELFAVELNAAPAIGGSNAQRDAIFDTWLAALRRSGDVARSLEKAAERSVERARHLDEDWFARLA